jgi:DNA-directed RNA polymerase beta' subunit
VAGAAPTVEQFRNLMHVKYMRAVVPAGEAVGVLASQSIGEPSTQMTLNSVDYVTPLAIVWRSTKRAPPAPVDGPVGALIDALMAERRAAVQVQPDGVTEYLPLEAGEAIALSADERGHMRWTPLEAVTRHPVVNRDGSSTLMRVSLRSGRAVDVTRAKSILVVRDGRVVAVDGDELRVGDSVPVVHGGAKRPSGEDDVDDEVDTRTFAPVDGMPHMLRLTRAFGFFLGAYLAAGHIAADGRRVSIASSVPVYRERVAEWPAVALGVTACKTSARVAFHSPALCSLMTAMCNGGGSCDEHRRLPAFVLRANRDFALGVLDGFVSSGRRSSRSMMVRDGIATLLARFGEHSTLTQAALKHRVNGRTAMRPSFGLVRDAAAVDVLADVALDVVVTIGDVEPTHARVYDLTVAETRNMCTMSGVALADTFHLAGRGDLNVTLGIPRLREVLMAGGRNLETPSMRVALSNTKDRASAQQCARALSRVLLVDVLHGITCVEKLYYDADAARWSRRYTLRLQLQSESEHKDRCSRASIVGALGARSSHNFVTHVLAAVYNELHSTRKLRMTRSSGGDVGDDDGTVNKRARRGDDDGGDDDGDGGGNNRGDDDGEMLADADDNKQGDNDDEGGDDDESASADSDSSESGSSVADNGESRAKRARSAGTDTDTDDDGANDGANEDELTMTDATNPADSSTSAHDPEGPSDADVDFSAIPDKYSAAVSYLTSFHYSRQTNTATVVISTSLESKMLLLLTMAENAAQDTVVRQVAGIKRAVVVESKGGDFEVQTDGINLASTLRLSSRIVDVRRLYCNDIHAVCGMFGIEAARNAIVRELGAVFGAYGINVDRRHINLVADALTRSGQYRAFNRGTFDDASSPIQQMTFETVARFLASAALSGLEDHVEGASARICVGLPIRNGTGLSDALLDVTALK